MKDAKYMIVSQGDWYLSSNSTANLLFWGSDENAKRFSTREEAESFRTAMKEKGYGCCVIKNVKYN